MRLIDADDFDVITYKETESYSDYFDSGVLYMLDRIDAAPTVDAVEVVRCEKCRHWHRCMQGDVEILAFSKCLKGNPLGNGNNYFCADGERKEATE